MPYRFGMGGRQALHVGDTVQVTQVTQDTRPRHEGMSRSLGPRVAVVPRRDDATRREGRGAGLLYDLVVPALANAVGTLVSGVLLGSFAVRVGLIDVDDDALNNTANFAVIVGVSLTGVGVIVSLAFAVVASLDRGGRRKWLRKWVHTLRGLFIAGAVINLLWYASLLLADFDPDGLILFAWSTAFLAAVWWILGVVLRVRLHESAADAPRTGEYRGE
jgi:hypothetical protein